MIQPSEIQTKVFTKAVRGYSAEEVDVFLDQITLDLEQLLRENDQLKQTVAEQKEKMDKYKSQEGAMLNTLEAAKSLMNDISASAEKRADILIRNAELDADLKLREARETVQRLKEEELNLNHKVLNIKTRLKSFLSSELERLDDMGEDLLEAIKAAEDVPSTLTPALDSSSEKFLNDLENTVVYKEPLEQTLVATQMVDPSAIEKVIKKEAVREAPEIAVPKTYEFVPQARSTEFVETVSAEENAAEKEPEKPVIKEVTEEPVTNKASGKKHITEKAVKQPPVLEEVAVKPSESEERPEVITARGFDEDQLFKEVNVKLGFDTPVVPFGFFSKPEEVKAETKEEERSYETVTAAEELVPVYNEVSEEIFYGENTVMKEFDTADSFESEAVLQDADTEPDKEEAPEELNLEDIFNNVQDIDRSGFNAERQADADTAAFLNNASSDDNSFFHFDQIPDELKNTLSRTLSSSNNGMSFDTGFDEPSEELFDKTDAEPKDDGKEGEIDVLKNGFDGFGKMFARFRGQK